MFDSIVLGIDPGLTRCGWGVVGTRGPKFAAVDYGVIATSPDSSRGHRLSVIFDGLREIIVRECPTVAAIEQVLFNINVRTAMNTAAASGVAELCCAQNGVDLYSYTPTQVKAATAGFGAADKAQMRKAVTHVLRLDVEPPTDAADALGVAFCHATGSSLLGALDTAAPRSGARRASSRLAAAIAKADAASGPGRANRRPK